MGLCQPVLPVVCPWVLAREGHIFIELNFDIYNRYQADCNWELDARL